MKSIAIFLTLAATALAQTTCDKAGFELCKTNMQQFETATCGPLPTGIDPTSKMDLNAACLCYAAVNMVGCYDRCPADPEVAAELAGGAIPKQTALCAAANLNPANLPKPAPWDKTAVPTTSPIAVPTATTPSSSTATPTNTPSTKENAAFALEGAIKAVAAGVAGAAALIL
ncbi:hypothetical protein HDU85_007602 [Gaertneriomyces sp. JEL0708]|nr:hypothetical protein HDU85_007602 [Gaertneriomyces sp. JEL0708]